jgi:hypothetical protein
MEKVEFGTYSGFAVKDGEGFSIENQSPGQKVSITAGSPRADVTIRLRARGGVLIGSVRDKSTGKAVKLVNVQYLALDGTAAGNGRGDGEFQVTIPSEIDLLVVVSAPGYKGWVYTNPSDPSHPVLRLQGGEKKTLEAIDLEPKAQP